MTYIGPLTNALLLAPAGLETALADTGYLEPKPLDAGELTNAVQELIADAEISAYVDTAALKAHLQAPPSGGLTRERLAEVARVLKTVPKEAFVIAANRWCAEKEVAYLRTEKGEAFARSVFGVAVIFPANAGNARFQDAYVKFCQRQSCDPLHSTSKIRFLEFLPPIFAEEGQIHWQNLSAAVRETEQNLDGPADTAIQDAPIRFVDTGELLKKLQRLELLKILAGLK